jgi:hypothetical protein
MKLYHKYALAIERCSIESIPVDDDHAIPVGNHQEEYKEDNEADDLW